MKPEKKKLNFFLDVDGTLLPVGKGVPESAEKALEKAKALGYRLFFCTGRSRNELSEKVKYLPFDGGVFSAGACVMFHNRIIMQKYASNEQKKLFFEAVDKYNLLCFSQGPEATYTTEEAVDFYNFLTRSIYSGTTDLEGFRLVSRFPDDVPLIKSYIMSKEGRVLEARRALEGPFHCVNNTTGLPEINAAEVMVAGISKGFGMEWLINFLGEGLETSVGIGDGENDLEMIEKCRLGIAMGNSDRALKVRADFVTTDIGDDGLSNAIEYALNVLGSQA